jgi:hypothetical protein
MSKGSRPRPYSVSQKEFGDKYDAIFGKKESNNMQVKVQEDEKKIGSCGCGRSPTGKCIGWHGLTEEAYAQRKEDYETGRADLAGKEIK